MSKQSGAPQLVDLNLIAIFIQMHSWLLFVASLVWIGTYVAFAQGWFDNFVVVLLGGASASLLALLVEKISGFYSLVKKTYQIFSRVIIMCDINIKVYGGQLVNRRKFCYVGDHNMNDPQVRQLVDAIVGTVPTRMQGNFVTELSLVDQILDTDRYFDDQICKVAWPLLRQDMAQAQLRYPAIRKSAVRVQSELGRSVDH